MRVGAQGPHSPCWLRVTQASPAGWGGIANPQLPCLAHRGPGESPTDQSWPEGPPGPRPAAPSPLQVLRGYNYRTEVRKRIPQLRVLDEVPAAHPGQSASWKPGQDWLLVKEAIKAGSVLDGLLPGLGTAASHQPSGKGCLTQPGPLPG